MSEKFPFKPNKVIIIKYNYIIQILTKSNKQLKEIKKEMQFQKKINSGIKFKKPKFLKKTTSIKNLNLKESNSSKKFDFNKNIYNKSISLTSTITKTNSNASSQKELSNINEKLNKYINININSNLTYEQKSKKNNLYLNTLFTDTIKKDKQLY